jgi:prepilin-type N-terminal cleavage/methylation domain-containing protein
MRSTQTHDRASRPSFKRASAFTLIELLVAIAILALLAGLTVKGVRKMREAAYATDTTNELMTIQNAIQNYHSTYNAYPGPLPNRSVGAATANIGWGISFPTVKSSNTAQFDTTGATDLAKLTGTENLVLGLFGGLRFDSATNTVIYDPASVGQGPVSLNQLSPGGNHGAYLENQSLLSWHDVSGKKSGKYTDDAGQANDTIVPELVDRFPQGMPILYLRSDKGAVWNSALSSPPDAHNNNIITDDKGGGGDPTQNVGQFHLSHITGYTAATPSIGENRKPIAGKTDHGLKSVDLTKTITGDGPYDAYPYLFNPSVSTQSPAATPHSGDVARKKDELILISPGPDRIYGTKDDITSFGSVTGG